MGWFQFMQIDHACSFYHIKMLHMVTYDSDYVTQADWITEFTDPPAAMKMKI